MKYYEKNEKTLNQVYKKPSAEKQRIYEDYVCEAISHRAVWYGISSYNNFVFTFRYHYFDEKLGLITVEITPKHKYKYFFVDNSLWESIIY